MGFSYIIEIGNLIYNRFGNLKIRESADGFGTSGVCTSELTFTMPYDEYLLHVPYSNADVKIYAGEDFKIAATYYISSRSRKGGTVSFKCSDRMIFTNQTIVLTDNDFKDDMIDAFWLLDNIKSQCEFTAYGVIGITELADISVPREKVEGRSCYECLQLLSSAWCGFFKVSNDDKLVFVPFGKITGTISGDTKKMRHTAVAEGLEKGPITRLIMSNGSETFGIGSGEGFLNTLKISSDLASGELAASIFERIEGYTYQSWECSKIAYGNSMGVVDVMGITTEILFADGIKRVANYIEKTLTAYGLFVSCGSNNVTEDEFDYTGKLSREIANKISDGEELGNKTLITRYQGTIHLGEKKKSKGRTATSEPPKRYGYAPATYEGVVKFDGAMVDKTLPEIVVKDDVSGFSTTYGDTVIKYDLKWDGDNVTLKEKEEAQ